MNLVELALREAGRELGELEGVVSWACTPLQYRFKTHTYVVTACVEYGTVGYDPDAADEHVTVHTVLVTISMMGMTTAEILSSVTKDLV